MAVKTFFANLGDKIKNLWKLLVDFVKDFFAHWNTPPKEGYYLPNKEFLAYSVGGMGVYAMGIFAQFFAIQVGVHLSVVYDFDQKIVMYTGWIMAFLSMIRAPIVGWLIDNTNTKWGKYRPHLLWSGVATVLLYWLLAFIPNLFMPGAGEEYTETRKWLVIGSYQVVLFFASTAYNIYAFGRVGISQVITPNTNERTKLYSIGGVIDSLGPSIVQLLFPLLAGWVYGQNGLVYGKEYGSMTAEEIAQSGMTFGLENINTYRVIFPIMGLVCVAVSLIMFFGTKERIIQDKQSKENKISFIEGLTKAFKNKYFWIINSSNVLGFGRLLIFGSVNYICAYMIGLKNPSLGENLRGLLPTIMAVGFTPSMLLSPIIQKHLGKKKMTLISLGGSSLLSFLIMFLVLFAYDFAATPYLICVGIFLHNVFLALYTVTSPAMTADYCEYQQWKTGERFDAYMNQYSTLITTISGMGTGYLLTALLLKCGAEDAVDYANPVVMRNVFILWAVLGAVSGVLAMVPFFFWDLTEEKQLLMAKDMKIRAYTKDLEDGSFDIANAKEAIALGVLTEEAACALGYVPEIIEANADEAPVAEEVEDIMVEEVSGSEAVDSPTETLTEEPASEEPIAAVEEAAEEVVTPAEE